MGRTGKDVNTSRSAYLKNTYLLRIFFFNAYKSETLWFSAGKFM